MSDGAPPGEAPDNPYSRLFTEKAGSRVRPVVPKLALMSPSPSPPPAPWPKAAYQGPVGQADWVQAVHERHRPQREAFPRVEPGRPESEDAVNELGRLHAQARTAALGVSSSSASKAGHPPVLLSQAMEEQQAYHREVGATFQSGFEPQRHSTFVLGRPVQAGLMNRTSASHDTPKTLLLMLQGSFFSVVHDEPCRLHALRFWR